MPARVFNRGVPPQGIRTFLILFALAFSGQTGAAALGPERPRRWWRADVKPVRNSTRLTEHSPATVYRDSTQRHEGWWPFCTRSTLSFTIPSVGTRFLSTIA